MRFENVVCLVFLASLVVTVSFPRFLESLERGLGVAFGMGRIRWKS